MITFILLFTLFNIIPQYKTIITRAEIITVGPSEYYQSIQQAINNAIPGDEIHVLNGVYYENLIINKTINLIGENKNTTIINANFSGNNTLNILSYNTKIKNFTIENADEHGIYIENIENLTIENCIIQNNNECGIYINSSKNVTIINSEIIENCLMQNNLGSGILIKSSNYINITDSEIENNLGYGVLILASTFDKKTELNNISNCKIFENSYSGICIRDVFQGDDFFYAENNSIINCEFYENGKEGAQNFTKSAVSISLINGRVTNTTIANCLFYYPFLNGYNIHIAGNIVENNTFYHNNFLSDKNKVFDEGQNIWYNKNISEGNFWLCYDEKSEGAYDNNSDGIIDKPYNITGLGNNKDLYPLTNNTIGLLRPIAYTNGPYNENIGVAIIFDGSNSTDLDGNITEYKWDFGDGANASGAKPTHSYSISGNFTVTLTVTDDLGFTDSETTTTHINAPPIANAGGPYYQIINQTINFNGSKSYDIDGIITNYTWDFGDGNISYIQNPEHSYNISRIFNVTLTVTNNRSITDTDTTTASIIINNTQPVANAGGPYSGNVSQTINFDGSSSNDSDTIIVNYTWDFGDEEIGYGITPTHKYTNTGNFTITLTVIDYLGATNNNTTYANITNAPPNNPPIANAGGPYNATIDETITFNGSNSTDIDGNITEYKWDFGDGANASGITTTHSYLNSGSFTVTLTVTDNYGANNSNTTTALINTPPANIPPIADAGGDEEGYYYETINQYIEFDGSASYDQDGTITKYTWNFGDGRTGTGVKPKHKYSSSGDFTVTLTVKDNDNATDTDTAFVYIFSDEEQDEGDTPTPKENKKPEANAGGPYYDMIGIPIQFDGSDSYDPDGKKLYLKWNFGDGNTSTSLMPKHAYLKIGNYTVSLTVTDTNKSTDTDTTYAIITKKPNNPPEKPTITGTSISHVNKTCNYTIKGSDIDGDKIQYIINWNDTTNQTISPLLKNNTAFNTSHNWSTGGIYVISVYTLDENNATSETQTYNVLIDVHICSSLGYLIDKNGDGIYDVIYRETTGKETTIQKNLDEYNIDINNDTEWDYIYSLTTNNLKKYSDYTQEPENALKLDNIWMLLIGIVCIITIIIILLIFKIKAKKPYEIKIKKKKREKPIKIEEQKPKIKQKRIRIRKKNQIYAFNHKDKKMKKIHRDVDKVLSKKK